MRYAKFLKETKTISLVAPSFGCTTEPYKSRLKKAIEILENMGFNFDIGPNVYSSIDYRSNTNTLCAKEIMDYYEKGNLMISVGGGILEGEIIDYIDFNKLKALPPCWFLGYSDNTYLTFLFPILLDCASIYSVCASELGTDNLYKSQLDLIELIKGDKLKFKGYPLYEKESIKSDTNPFAPYNLTEKKVITSNILNPKFEGRLLGGCLDCLHELIGTPYDKVDEFIEKYKNDGIIWFLESCDLKSYQVKLTLLHLKRAGWFKNAKGFIIGRPLEIDDKIGDLDMHKAVLDVLSDLNLPILLDCDLGHIKPTIPFICGAYAKVKYSDELEIEYILK